jgi:hypothetical protein
MAKTMVSYLRSGSCGVVAMRAQVLGRERGDVARCALLTLG